MAVTAGAGMAHALLERLEAEGKLDEGLRYEILNGELVIRGAPTARHGSVVSLLARYLGNWTAEHGGEVVTGVGVELDDQQLLPDLAFVLPDRMEELDADGFHVPPDLVAEVTSPGTRSLDLNEKREACAEIGVGEYWVIDLQREVVVVHRRDVAGADQPTQHRDGALTTPVAPGLEVPLADLFPRN